MMTTMNLYQNESFATLYRNVSSDQGMMQVMCQMQTKYGIHEHKALANADEMVHLVVMRQNFNNLLSEDAEGVLEEFLKASHRMGGYERKVLLHQLYFGLKMYQHPEMLQELSEGTSKEKLFRNYYAKCGEDPSITCDVLEYEIRRLMGDYHISADMMRVVAKKLEKGQDMLATAAALGENGLRFQCITAMDLYLRNQDTMTMAEAANVACTHVGLEAAADASGCGMLSRKRTQKLLMAVALGGILFGLAMWFFAPQIMTIGKAVVANPGWIAANQATKVAAIKGVATGAKTVHKAVMVAKDGLLLGSLCIAAISDKAAEWMGRVAAERTFARKLEESKAAEALYHLADGMDEECEEEIYQVMPAEKQMNGAVQKHNAQTFC